MTAPENDDGVGDDEVINAPPVWYWDFTDSDEGRKSVKARVWADSWQALSIDDKLRIGTLIREHYSEFPGSQEPDCIFINTHHPVSRSFPDLAVMNGAALFVSGALIDLLSQFNLGPSPMIELPFFDQKNISPYGDRAPDLRPDRDKPIPGRWGMLHVLARKSAFVPEQARYFRGPCRSTFDGTQEWRLDPGENFVVALKAATVCKGVDIWRDPRLPNFMFFSDRLITAIGASGLRMPAFADLGEAKLV